MSEELNKLCRTCLAPEKGFKSIYEEDEPKIDSFGSVADIIGILTNMMPIKSDGLPELVCLTCSDEIKKIHSFQMKCIDSERILRKMLKHTDEEETMVVSHDKSVESIKEENTTANLETVSIKSEEPTSSNARKTNNEQSQDSSKQYETLTFEVTVKDEPYVGSDMELGQKEVAENEDLDLSAEYDYDNASEVEQETSETRTDANEENESVEENDPKLKCPNCDKRFHNCSHVQAINQHFLWDIPRHNGKIVRRRCTSCYKNLKKMGAAASLKAKQVHTECKQCKKAFCLMCFNDHHRNKY